MEDIAECCHQLRQHNTQPNLSCQTSFEDMLEIEDGVIIGDFNAHHHQHLHLANSQRGYV